MDYPSELDHCLKYSADQRPVSEDSRRMLDELYYGDHHQGHLSRHTEQLVRDATADAIQDDGREEEANLLRSRHPVTFSKFGVFYKPDYSSEIVPGYQNNADGYPAFYIHPQGSLLCADCVNDDVREDPHGTPPMKPDIHWEGPPISCDGCGCEIESAYGDPYADEHEDDQ